MGFILIFSQYLILLSVISKVVSRNVSVGTLFSRERCAAPRFAPVPLTLAHLLLFHRRLDG